MRKIVLGLVAAVFLFGGCATPPPVKNISAEPVVGPNHAQR